MHVYFKLIINSLAFTIILSASPCFSDGYRDEDVTKFSKYPYLATFSSEKDLAKKVNRSDFYHPAKIILKRDPKSSCTDKGLCRANDYCHAMGYVQFVDGLVGSLKMNNSLVIVDETLKPHKVPAPDIKEDPIFSKNSDTLDKVKVTLPHTVFTKLICHGYFYDGQSKPAGFGQHSGGNNESSSAGSAH